MIDALVPGARALRELRIVAHGVDRRLQNPMLPRLRILRHEEDIALLLPPYLVHKLGKAGGVGQVDIGVRFHAVPVTAGDSQHVPLLSQAPRSAVFFPMPQPIQLQRVQIVAVPLQELVYQKLVLLPADQVQIPHRMVEDHQYVWIRVQRRQDLGEPRVARAGRKTPENLHPLRGARAGQVVYAQVERLLSIGSAPLQRYRNAPCAGHRPQQHRRLNRVVIGEGNHGRQVQLFDLLALQIERQLGGHRRRPVSGRIVHPHPVHFGRPPLQPRKQRTHYRVLVAEVRQKIQRLLRLVGMTVQGNA